MLADVAGLQRTRFIKSFRNAIGETSYRYLLRIRLEAARLSIIATSLGLTETALDSGFHPNRT